MKFFTFRPTAILLLAFVFSQNLFAQKAGLQVNRCSAVDKSRAVRNIHVDADNSKWVGSARALSQVRACDLGTAVTLGAGERSALLYPGGNADVRWTDETLNLVLSSPATVTAAFYDAANDFLWLGTKEAGLLQLKTKPALSKVAQFNTANSKLRSNEINNVYLDKTGRLWVASRDGMMVGTPGKWRGELQGYDVSRVREYGADLYVLADGEFWIVERGEKVKAIPIPDNAVESDPIDFDIDPQGNLWMLSAIVTRLSLLTDEFETFSGPEDYTSQFGRCIAADQDGAIWIGTDDKGLYVIDKASSLTVNVLTEKELSCGGNGKDGALRVKVSGGKAPFTYEWSASGLSGEAPQNLAAGAYTVTVTDASGKTKSAKTTLADPVISLSPETRQPESGPGKNDGQAEVKASGGSGSYTYKWDSGETGASAKKLGEGVHHVTVTDSRGCTATASVTISQKLATLEVKVAETEKIKCNNATTSLKASVSGGKPPYKYAWSNPSFTGEQPANVPRGEYQLTVTDATGVTAMALVKITDPELLVVQVTVQAPASTGKSDGKAGAQVRGGTPPYNYLWDTGENGPAAAALGPGDHSLKVTDANGCNAGFVFKVTENILPLSVSIAETEKIKCQSEKTSLKASVNGGKTPFKYNWSNPALSGDQPAGVSAGAYKLTVTDAAGGTATAEYVLKEPDLLVAVGEVVAPASTGGSDGKMTVKAKGGTGKYNYAWDNGEATANATKLSAGMHWVTVTDENGCKAMFGGDVPENILPLSVSLEQPETIKCNGDKTSLKVVVKGGKAPFKYAWNNSALSGEQASGLAAGTYQVTVTDATGSTQTAATVVKTPDPVAASAQATAAASTGGSNGKAAASASGGSGKFTYQWDNGESTATASKLTPGKHSVTVTDANGCTATASVDITENILPLSVSIEETGKIKCAGDKTSLKASVSGGKEPFKYAWNNPSLNGDQPINVIAGDYQLTVSDASGKTASAKINVVQPASLSLIATVQSPASAGNSDGKAVAQPRGGTSPYIFAWDNGESTATAVRLGPGKHAVTATDANGCTAGASFDMSENILPLTVQVEVQGKIKCANETVSLKANVGGGKGPFEFAWNNPALQGNAPSGVTAGDYQLTVTDAQGKTQTATASVKAPAALSIEVVRNIGATTDRSNDGRVLVKATGGTGVIGFAWDNGETSAQTQKLSMGIHHVTATDANGCTAKADVEVKQRILPALTAGQLQSGQTIRMEQLRFEADSSSLNESCLPVLNELYDFLSENGGIVIEIGGHTNSTPPDEFCDRLSTARAKSVADYLISKGIAPQRVAYKGYGKRKPIASNSTAEGRKMNQRVEVKILKLDN